MNTIPRPLAKSGPTEDILRQCGHRAKALFNVLNWKNWVIYEIFIDFNVTTFVSVCQMFVSVTLHIYMSHSVYLFYIFLFILYQLTKNVSWQWAQPTLHMPGIDRTGGVMGLGARLIIRLQFGLGQAIRCEELLHISRQLQGHRTYFFPGGAFLMGCVTNKKEKQ